MPEEWGGPRRRRRRFPGPALPPDVEGLVQALGRDRVGDARPLDAWFRDRYPVLERACAAWLGNPDWGERIARRTTVEAFRACRQGFAPAHERSWLARVALLQYFTMLREDRRDGVPGDARGTPIQALAQDALPQSQAADPSEAAAESEAVALARTFVDLLPPPQRQIARLRYLEGAPTRAIRQWLRIWRPVGDDEARRMVKRTYAMLRALGEGKNLREQWPLAFHAGRNRWLTTPPPPFDAPT